jgi:uncharacterized protein YkwD
MLELVNRSRANPSAEAARFGIDLNEGITTELISADPKQPLTFNPKLLQAARGHSQWMLDNDVFEHVETNGKDPGDRMRDAGYVFRGSWTYGENISWRGTTGPMPAEAPTAALEHQDLFVDEGIEERGHRQNVLAPAFREVGIGVEPGVFTYNAKAYNAIMVSQDFGASGANPGPFLLGVVYRDEDNNGAYSAGEGLAGVNVTVPGAAFYTVSSASGGYAIPVTGLAGTRQVIFSGGALSRSITKEAVLGGSNVKLDFELGRDSVPALSFTDGTARFTPPSTFQVELQGPTGIRVSFQRSNDFQSWTEIRQVDLTGAPVQLNDTAATPAYRFYRAVQP